MNIDIKQKYSANHYIVSALLNVVDTKEIQVCGAKPCSLVSKLLK